MNGSPQQIAETILEQLGGHKFLAMTGATDRNYGTDETDGNTYLTMRLPRGSTLNKATHVKIKLVGDSHYEMTFIKCSTRPTLKIVNLKTVETIPENMREAFTRETGLRCTLGTLGK